MEPDDERHVTTLGRVLVEALRDHGAGEIFGLPGDFALPLFHAFAEARVLPIHCLMHEPAVGFAADAAARVRGGLGVALVTWGAGALNMVNPIANAYAERSPVVVISGAPGIAERARGFRLHHQVKSVDSQRRVYDEVTCDSAVIDSVQRAPEAIARVLRSALEHSLPVYLEVPRDLVSSPCEAVVPLPSTPWDPGAARACAEEILARLARAERPALLVDVEVRRFGLEARVAELARRLGLPVATTFLGGGLMADHPELVRGTYLGAAGDPAIATLIEDADVLFGLGIIPSDTNLGIATTSFDWRRVIDASERSVRLGYHRYDNLPLAAIVDALLAASAPTHTPPSTSAPRPTPTHTSAPAPLPSPAPSDGALVRPEDVIAAVERLRADSQGAERWPITADVGDCLFAAVDLLPGPLVASGYYATMGMAIPAALGIQASTGERAIALVGDGAFHMTGSELANANRAGWDPIVIVFNNAEWTMLKTFTGPSPLYDLADVDLAAVARSFGGDGYTVRRADELDRALENARQRRGHFQLIDVRLAPGCVSRRLASFASAFGARRDPT